MAHAHAFVADDEGFCVNRLKITVVMATYNGRRYLDEQLRSILRQTRPPDELLINDDGSTDGSAELIRSLVQNQKGRIDFRINKERLGAVRNFDALVHRATGDIIFFSDQDDIWSLNKIARVEHEFASHPSIGAVFSDARVINERSEVIQPSLWKLLDFSSKYRRAWASGKTNTVLVRRSIAAGATLAFRSRYRRIVLPFSPHAIHDFWVAVLIAQVASVGAIAEPLVDYRIHPANQVGVGRTSILWDADVAAAESWRELKQFEALRQRLEAMGLLGSCVQELVDAKIEHLSFRVHLPRSVVRRAGAIAIHLASGDYSRYARGMRSAVGDLLRGPGMPERGPGEDCSSSSDLS